MIFRILRALFAAIILLSALSLSGCSGKGRLYTLSVKETRADAYYLKAYRNHKYIFEHNGHIITAKCISTVRPGPNGEAVFTPNGGDCAFISPYHVGDYYGDDLVVDLGTQLRFIPDGINKQTVEDVLEVESEEKQ
jgi:hypothetical protein